MVPGHMYVSWYASGNFSIYAYHSDAFLQPILNTNQSLTFIAGSLYNGFLFIEFDRLIDTGNPEDANFDPYSPVTAIWAINPTTPPISPTFFFPHSFIIGDNHYFFEIQFGFGNQ